MSDLHMSQPKRRISVEEFKKLSKEAVVFMPSCREPGIESDGSFYYKDGLGYSWWHDEGDVIIVPVEYRITNISLKDLTARMSDKLERLKAML